MDIDVAHPVETPLRRPIRVFAFDPMRRHTKLDVLTIEVENEPLQPGPQGARVQVVDYDGTRKTFYEPVHLDDPAVLMQGGLAPSESDPRFHQQMVYAVTLKVLENFDRALGRRITFRGRPLRLLPHAFRDANAFFDPGLNAVCFGYFCADTKNPGENLPGQTVFTCLSQDIIAHEVTHAVVHRLRRHFLEPSNEDVLAFHEGFADIVAIFQHFTFPDVLRAAIAATRGNIDEPTELVKLASQFGHATGKNDALRTALGAPDPMRIRNATEPHERGSILVAAVFDAFFTIYRERARDLIRIASEGRGVLPEGDLHPDLVDRLTREAAGAAQDILTMCIRAFEYLPPVDITFGDYLRALVTADYDLVAEQGAAQRRAMIEGFRRRGIYPDGVISLAEDSLRWPLIFPELKRMPGDALARLLVTGAKGFRTRARGKSAPEDIDRGVAVALREWAKQHPERLGLDPGTDRFDVQGFHSSYRVRPSGELVVEVVAQFVQLRNTSDDPSFGGLPIRGGSTVIASANGDVRFVIAKPLTSEERSERQRAYVARRDLADPRLPYGGDDYYRLRARADFRALHRGLVA